MATKTWMMSEKLRIELEQESRRVSLLVANAVKTGRHNELRVQHAFEYWGDLESIMRTWSEPTEYECPHKVDFFEYCDECGY